MVSAPAVNDNQLPEEEQYEDGPPLYDDALSLDQPVVQSIISTAVLLRTAFRLRDEAAMVSLLRNLANCVDRMEQEEDAA